MAAISQKAYLNTFSRMTYFNFHEKFIEVYFDRINRQLVLIYSGTGVVSGMHAIA